VAALPLDVRERATNRLASLALLLAAGALVETVVGDLAKYLQGFEAPPLERQWDYTAVGTLVSVSLAVYAVLRRRALGLTAQTTLGSVYLVVAAFVISFGDHSDRFWVSMPALHGIPYACVLIVLFPLMVPLGSARTVLIGSAMAATGPLSLWTVAAVMDAPPVPTTAVVDLWITQQVFAVLAVVPARVVHRLGAEIQRARELGAYRLEERLGQGGMGEVWRARHRFLARPAAVKLIRRELTALSPDQASAAVERFEREAQATASLRSAHTVQLYDFGRTEDGTLYYAMELLDGFDMNAVVERFGPQSPERVVSWLLQVCRSLHEAHEAGLVHRDIKPANLFVCRNGLEVDFIKVLDFGLVALRAGARASNDPGEEPQTSSATLRGTPAFMSPEAITGASAPDLRADLYSLGCVAYWLLTGHIVFEGDTSGDVMIAHVERQPVRPSEISEQAIPEELERIILDCLAKHPEDRPADAGVLETRLEATGLAGAWTKERALEWWDLHAPTVGVHGA
jgi:hypothetical protein